VINREKTVSDWNDLTLPDWDDSQLPSWEMPPLPQWIDNIGDTSVINTKNKEKTKRTHNEKTE